jgi:hypothetical protein
MNINPKGTDNIVSLLIDVDLVEVDSVLVYEYQSQGIKFYESYLNTYVPLSLSLSLPVSPRVLKKYAITQYNISQYCHSLHIVSVLLHTNYDIAFQLQ